MSVHPLPVSAPAIPLPEAIDRFLDRFREDPGTRATYAETLARLRMLVGDRFPTGDLTPEVYAAVMANWDARAASTWNKHLSALRSFTGYGLGTGGLSYSTVAAFSRSPARS